ncbi:MAG: DNA-3-methyladenine glycosylase 2 family protein, partial [SAR86 cluster bacterium]|nr:DNA-3-methyladenine glycosylase 2 family protein [SAR86 cluster bacterium]
MNSLDYKEGVKHLLKVEPAFKSIIPKTKISFFLRPEGFEGMASLIIEQQLSVKAANT